MFHVKHLVFVLLLFPLLVRGQAQFSLQDKTFEPTLPIDTGLMVYIHSEIKGKGYTEEEKQFFYWSNYLRLHPKEFYKGVIEVFIKEFPEVKGKEAESLKKDLLSMGTLSRYQYSSLLSVLAVEQASDLALKANQISHVDSKGRGFAERMKLGGVTKCAAENIYTGKNDGLLALLMLLFDLGLEQAGHRKNILNPTLTQMGLSIRPHKTEKRIVLVQIFGCN